MDSDTIDRIDELAIELVGIVRGENGSAQDVATLTRTLDRAELIGLAISIAALVDVDKSVPQLLAWMDPPDRYEGWTADELRDAHAAFGRGVRMDQIVKGEKIYQRVMYKRRSGVAS
jgi:hypothetical protein